MRKAFIVLLILLIQMSSVYSSVVYQDGGKFGLKSDSGEVITEAKYKKLVRLGETSWIMQDGVKFGIIGDSGNVVVEPKYNKAERVLGRFVKFAKGDKYGILDETGFEILPVEYSSIDLLYGGMFVTCKNYKYGICDLKGQMILDNIFDDIYMPNYGTLVIVYGKKEIHIERKQNEAMSVPYDVQTLKQDIDKFKFDELVSNPIVTTGYYGVTFTDYILKLISSISPAYEQTIDELMFSQGADTVSVLKRFSWLPKFPFVYMKKYYRTVADPSSGPLNGMKSNLKGKMQ